MYVPMTCVVPEKYAVKSDTYMIVSSGQPAAQHVHRRVAAPYAPRPLAQGAPRIRALCLNPARSIYPEHTSRSPMA